MIKAIVGLIGWVMVGFWGMFALCLLWSWIQEMFVWTRKRRLIAEMESELRRANIRRSLNEDMGIEGDNWVDQESWIEDDGREWWLRDQDSLGDR